MDAMNVNSVNLEADMLNEKMRMLGARRSVIRELFEYGKTRKAEIGEENVFDFSLGNPSVAAPEIVRERLVELLQGTDPVKLHGYTSAQGDAGVRSAIADYLNRTYDANVTADCFYLTAGAAASLTVSLIGIVYPIVTRRMLNELIPNKEYRMIVIFGIALLALYFASYITSFAIMHNSRFYHIIPHIPYFVK